MDRDACSSTTCHTQRMPHGLAAGFTLIELIIVITVISLLAMIAFPSALRARQNADDTKTVKELQSIYTAVVIFRASNNRSPTSWVELSPYVSVDTNRYELNPNMS